MDKLSARIEAAVGPNRELDGLIFKAIFPDRDWVQFDDCWGARCEDDGCVFDMPFHYTASVDAALMLVPDGWNYMLVYREQKHARAYVNNGFMKFVGGGMKRDPRHEWYEVTAATPALAIAAAALKARGL